MATQTVKDSNKSIGLEKMGSETGQVRENAHNFPLRLNNMVTALKSNIPSLFFVIAFLAARLLNTLLLADTRL